MEVWVHLPNFVYVTYCDLALDIYGLFKMVFDCLWVVVDVFELVVGGCSIFRGGCRWL